MIALLWLACAADPPALSPGASVAVDTRMAGGALPLECSARLLARSAAESESPAPTSERPCGPELRWEGLEPGDYLLVIQGRTVATMTQAIALERDQALDLGRLALAPGGALTVRVFREAGDPGGLEVRVDGAPAARTDADGLARIWGAPVGEVEVSVRDGGSAAEAVVQVTEGEVVELVLELEPLPQRPVMGLRFKVTEAGPQVTWIHPDGPAAGRLLAGDVLTSVAGRSLVGLSASQAGPLLAGQVIGAPRRFELLRGGAPMALELAPVGAGDLAAGDEGP